MKWIATWLLVLMAFIGTPAQAAVEYPPRPNGPILDQADLLPPDREAALDARLRAENAKTGRSVIVATVPTLQGETIELYAVKLFEAWGIGGKETDLGMLLLIAPNERKMRIEVGYGLHGYMTDGLSGHIIRTVITPRFKDGDMAGGIEAGTNAILEQIARSPEDAKAVAEAAQAAQRENRHARFSLGDTLQALAIVFAVLFAFIFFAVRAAARGARRYRRGGGGVHPIVVWAASEAIGAALRNNNRDHNPWGGGGGFGGFGGGGGGSDWGGGGGGGGFGGFGGGGSGGGGASGGW